jgi:UDP-2,3-diacylglucosamine pyrophosphatase LpxH
MPGKFKIVVSDLHLSAGHEEAGNPLEDFSSDREFAALLGEITAESDRDGSEVELIVNGDAFEMLQVPHVDRFDPVQVYQPDQYHSSSEPDSARKMALIIDGHQPFFEALGRFIKASPPRRSVTFIKGNHDVNLHWTAVQDHIRRAIGASGGRAGLVTFEERCVSREGIYVEHGNQYAEVVDRLKDMGEPHDHDKPGQLAIPVGSWFVMDMFNQVEREKYWIDGVKPITALVWYALAYDFAFAARAIAMLLRAMPGIIRDGILTEPTPGQAGALSDLVLSLDDPTRMDDLATRYESDDAFRTQFNAEVVGLLAPTPELRGAKVAALTAVADPLAMGEQIQKRVHSSLYEMAKLRALEEGARLVTFGHTHDASVEPLPDGGVYINSGTWTWRADFSGAGKEMWRHLFEHPERFTDDRLLSYVRIDYDEAGQPSGQLLACEPRPASERENEEEEEPVEAFVSIWERVVAWFRGLWG